MSFHLKKCIFLQAEKFWIMLIIGIAGGSGSGKTTVVKKIMNSLPENTVSLISQDAYYKDQGHLSAEEKKNINFDHPESIEFKLLNKHIDKLKTGQAIEMPTYDYASCSRGKETIHIEPRKVIIVEGILIFTDSLLRDNLDIKVFVSADSDDRLMRIMKRDVKERGRTYDDVLTHYSKYVKIGHREFIAPTKRFADIIIPEGGNNHVGIEILTSRILKKLRDNI
jgi:uridine kinase